MLGIEPRPSSGTRIVLGGLYVLTAVALAWVLPPPFAPVSLLLLAVALVFEWRRTRSIGRLEWQADGDWWIGDSGPWRLRPATVLTPWLVVLVLEQGSRTRRVPLAVDSLPADQWRRLRARLCQHPVEVDSDLPREAGSP